MVEQVEDLGAELQSAEVLRNRQVGIPASGSKEGRARRVTQHAHRRCNEAARVEKLRDRWIIELAIADPVRAVAERRARLAARHAHAERIAALRDKDGVEGPSAEQRLR